MSPDALALAVAGPWLAVEEQGQVLVKDAQGSELYRGAGTDPAWSVDRLWWLEAGEPRSWRQGVRSVDPGLPTARALSAGQAGLVLATESGLVAWDGARLSPLTPNGEDQAPQLHPTLPLLAFTRGEEVRVLRLDLGAPPGLPRHGAEAVAFTGGCAPIGWDRDQLLALCDGDLRSWERRGTRRTVATGVRRAATDGAGQVAYTLSDGRTILRSGAQEREVPAPPEGPLGVAGPVVAAGSWIDWGSTALPAP